MDECSVVRHQQKTGSVVIEAAYWLYIAADELFRQDGQDTRVMAGLARALVIGRFVQGDVDMPAINPQLVINCKLQAIGFNRGTAIVDNFSSDADIAISDQFAAPLARAKALRLQDMLQCRFAHAATVAEILMSGAFGA